MPEKLTDIAVKLRSEYGIDDYYYPDIDLFKLGGIEKELENAQELGSKLKIDLDLEFYKSYFEEKKVIVDVITKNDELTKKLAEVSRDLTGAEIPPLLWAASGAFMILYQSVIHPYLKGYFHKLGELKAEEKQKLRKKIEEKIESEFQFEKDKEIIRLTINEYLERKWNE